MWFAVLAAELAALIVAVLALRGGRLLTEHCSAVRPLTFLLAVAVVVDVLIAAGDCRVLGDPHAALGAVVPCVAPAPRSGLTSAVRLAEQALVMAWPAAVSAAAWRVFGGTKTGADYSKVMHQHGIARLRGAILAACGSGLGSFTAWALAVGVLVLARPYGYPGDTPEAHLARAEVVKAGLLAWELFCCAGGLLAVARAWRPGLRWGRSPTHAAVLVLLSTEIAVALIGPFVRDPFTQWDFGRLLYLPGFLTAAAVLLARGRRLGPLP